MNKISTSLTCTADMSQQDDLVKCLVSDDSLLIETVVEMNPDETEGMDPDNTSTGKTFSCQRTLKIGAFLEMDQVLKILSTTSNCFPSIPMCTKEKVFYVLKNESNQACQADGEKCEFSGNWSMD